MSVLLRPWGHLHYRDQGPKGGLPVLMMNSLGTDLRMWQGVTDLLPELRCLGFDARGHGLSSTPPQPWTMADLAQDALALLQHLDIPRAVIAGCSIGGMTAQALGRLAPQHCAGLFLSNCGLRAGTAETWAARIDAIRKGGIGAIAGPILERWFAPDFLAGAEIGPWATMLVRNDPDGYIGTCQVLAATDLAADAPHLTMPVLFLAGSADLSIPPDQVRAAAAQIPGARVEVLAGSGHIPAIDNPARVADLLRAFHRGLM